MTAQYAVEKQPAGFALLLCALSAFSAPNEAVVREMARRTTLSPDEIRKYYNACDSGITLYMKICGGYQLTLQDMRLKEAYAAALAKAKEVGYEKSLRSAQRAWIAYRDATCAFEGEIGAGGGTLEGLIILGCKEQMTKNQVKHLEDIVSR